MHICAPLCTSPEILKSVPKPWDKIAVIINKFATKNARVSTITFLWGSFYRFFDDLFRFTFQVRTSFK
ncbi:hypothetical protein LEP1GSC103_3147 [Leptospira borgpetersenii serovar Javanica str. UI 09931]|uniref:Uncharacterized protein n=5 Tax=Leptospira borgpetersenii TaxID=174 RepID=M3H3T2_LEPBO|nr:hypothetical protein LBBP_02027 [Leptospira borgpetersenii serovar Ballum]AXX14667.1 hypothetical protein C4Q31_02930 [Leptospira borgpetersenii serovar Ceylonica]EKP14179.1 hypothetical protein LEP1GSC128_2934 [Leptospira borgpetersenii str. 200801926]EKQ92053.1 hypothetical protein LEP1GSC101_3483 [Leptospira borgpetersenii str. UI 09149]EKR01793.1 hypothetical protein LEP1GSC121_3871 [Leptospira borgpetersenii serovar Castellonis str. 200801910]EMG01754.1 hypothetical protein LEP1GSC123_